MAETLAFLVRLLVVRCLVFVVVQALMRKRVNAGALVTAGRTKAAFKSMAGLSVCVSTVSFGLHRRVRSVLETGKAE